MKVSQKMKDQSFAYQMLSRLQQDCEYYLGNDGRSRHDKHLWAGNPVDQIKEMRRLYDLLHEKPEWLTLEEIKEFENKMC